MSRPHIDHRDLLRFAEDKVNLPKDKADEYRAQARRQVLRNGSRRFVREPARRQRWCSRSSDTSM